MPIPSIGGAAFLADKGPKIIRMALHGHANRPFFHIVLTNVIFKVFLEEESPESDN